MNGKFIISIVAEDKKGLLALVISLFNKRSFEIESLNVSRTDIRNVVILTLEVILPVAEVKNTMYKLEKIIEVYKAIAYASGDNSLRKVGFFRVSKGILTSNYWPLLQKYGVIITGVFEDSLMLEKSGTDEDILELYNKLDGIYLLSFCKTGLILEKSLLEIEELCGQEYISDECFVQV